MKVYLAAPYQMKDTISKRAAELRELGIEVTSQWLDETHRANVQLQDLAPKDHQYYALRDVADLADADVFVLQPDSTETIKRQGRTVEMGIAVGIGLYRSYPVFVIGESEQNIFHYLPQVYHFPDWEATKARLVELAEIEKWDVKESSL